jgi:CHAT domain-containing protein/Tfp pilus assembly protein PilF
MFRLTLPLVFVALICSLAVNADQTELAPDASKLMQQADQDFAKDLYSQSLPKYEQAVKLLQQQNDRKAFADGAYKLGCAYIALGNNTEAQKVLNEALKIHEDLADKAASGMDLTRLGVIESNQGNYDKSLELAHKALQIQEAVANRKGIADAYRLIATNNEWQDKYDEALNYVQKAFEIYSEINDLEGIARCDNAIGGIYWKQGKLEEAMDQFNKALAIAESADKKDLISKNLGNIGLIYWNQGDPEKAFEYYEKSNVISQEIGTKKTQSNNLYNMAILRLEGGDYQQAQDLYQKSLNMARELGDKGLEGVCLEGLGIVYKGFGNFDISLEYFQKALKIAEEIGEKRAAAYAYRSLGELYSDKNPKMAMNYFQKARLINEEIGDKRGVAIVLDCISEFYWENGKYDLALNTAEESLRIYESVGAKGQSMWANRMIALGHQGKGELEEASRAFSKSIQLAKESDREDDLWQSLYGKGDVLKALGKTDEALELLKESIGILEHLRSEVNTAEQRAEYFQNKVNVYNDVIQILMTKQNLPEAFEYVQRSKARGFLDMLAEARVNREDILSADLRDRKKKDDNNLRKIQESIEAEYENDVVDRSKIQALVKQRNELELEYSNLILEIRKQNPQYADLQYPEALKLSDAQALLDPDSVLLEYSIGDSASWVFAITADSAAAFEIPSEKKIDDQVHNFREVLFNADPTFETLEQAHTRYVTQAQTLYAELVRPTETILKGKHTILLATDSVLSYLPFECLLTKSPGSKAIHFESLPYLVRDYEIYYVPSATVLASVIKNNRQKNDQQKQLLALADPLLKNDRNEIATIRGWGTLGPLPNARTEVQNIARLYPKDQVTVFEGKQASEKNFKQSDLQEYKRVHFASHGLIDEEKPEFSALVLSSDDKGSEDGYLTMREVFDLKLNADLVVLSACKTGLGKELRGEGVTGISRAFFCAGTPSVLVSLWDVSDRSTADFMASFYRNMEVKNMNKSAALREARLQMIASKKFSHPYYWAPFVLIGNK